MEKDKYMSPRTTRVSMKKDGFFLMASDTSSMRYSSKGLCQGGSISGNSDGGDVTDALSKAGFWDL
jgi:hypothetical protein